MPEEHEEQDELEGLGGVLGIVGIGLAYSVASQTWYLWREVAPVFADGTWELLADPSLEGHDPPLAQLLLVESCANVVLVAAYLLLLVLFFLKHRKFPGLYVAVLLANLLFLVADGGVAFYLLDSMDFIDSRVIREVSSMLVVCAIWVPYMLTSRRVRNTFLKPSAA